MWHNSWYLSPTVVPGCYVLVDFETFQNASVTQWHRYGSTGTSLTWNTVEVPAGTVLLPVMAKERKEAVGQGCPLVTNQSGT
jgi:hypothetical protein